MKTTLFSMAVAFLATLWMAVDAVGRQAWENGFLQSPDGRFVASGVHTSLEIPLPPEGISLRQAVTLKVRAMDGKDVLTLRIKEAKEPYQVSYGYVDLAWSPDSRRIACRNGGDLTIVDISTKEGKTISLSASSFRWLDSSQIVHVSRNNSVVRVSVTTGRSEDLYLAHTPDEFHSSTSPYHNQISPDCRLYVFMDDVAINILDLQKKAVVRSLKRAVKPAFCWWNDKSDLCLINGLAEVKTGKAPPEDTGFLDVVYLFRRETGEFEELTDKLRMLNGNPDNTPRPDAPSRVWFSDGVSFLVDGCIDKKNPRPDDFGYVTKHWACHPAPWSALCVQEVGGLEFEAPSISPHGEYLMMNKAKRQAYCDGDWYLFKFSNDAQGKPQLTKPVKVLSSNSGERFWSSDGKRLITFNHGRFTVHDLP